MLRPYHFIAYELIGEVYCVRLQDARIEHHDLDDLSAELGRLIDEENCRKMVLNLGPEEAEYLLSVFLAKLMNLQRRMEGMGGGLTLAHASEQTRTIFRLAGIEKFFHFYPDQQSAVKALSTPA
jgi:anti-anti-sigma factor